MAKTVKDQWNANLYDQNHSFVSQFGTDLVQLLAPKQRESILDLGCGTGDLSRKISDFEAQVIGIDQSINMIEQAKVKYPEISFDVQDATELTYENEFDAIFSNATLHWIKQPEKALQGIFAGLKEGGRFVAEFGGKGNVQTITDEIIRQLKTEEIEFKDEQFPWFYPSIAEYAALMERVGFRVTFAQHFDRPTQLEGQDGLRNWIEMFGTQFFEGIAEQGKNKIVAQVEKNLKESLYKAGHWYADYKRIRVVGVKE